MQKHSKKQSISDCNIDTVFILRFKNSVDVDRRHDEENADEQS